MKPAFALVPLVALASCASAAPVTQHEGPAALGQATYVDGPVVTPLTVVEDSRCPVDATCFWAGRVVLRVRVGLGRGPVERELILGEPVPVADGALTLTAVTPEPYVDREIAPGDYRFTFAFAGGL